MSSVSVNPPKTPVTKGSNGIACATIPNVCKMPGPPAPFVPVPLPNIGKSGMSPKDYSQDVTIEGNAVAIRGSTFESMGDIASKGTGGGLISANTHGITKFIGPGSMDVQIEGKNVQLLSDPMLNNCAAGGSPPNAATMVGLLQPPGLVAIVGDEKCYICDKEHGDEGKLEETKESKGALDSLKAVVDAAISDAQTRRKRYLPDLKQRMQDAADKKYNDLLDQYTKARDAAKVSGSKRGEEFNQARIDGLTRKVYTDDEVDKLAPKVTLGAMLGAVVCKANEKFVGKSLQQLKEIAERVRGMHTPPHSAAIFDPEPAEQVAAKSGASMNDFLKHVKNRAGFEAGWARARDANIAYNSAPVTTRVEDKGEPFYPPGQCAGQQMMVLTLDHGARPLGMTERWYKHDDPNAKVFVYARQTKADKAGQGRWFGGLNKDPKGDPESVPPCGSCQIILTMLLCPDERAKECEHKNPGSKVCRCP